MTKKKKAVKAQIEEYLCRQFEVTMEIVKIAEQIKKLYNPNRTLIVGIDGLVDAGKSTVSKV